MQQTVCYSIPFQTYSMCVHQIFDLEVASATEAIQLTKNAHGTTNTHTHTHTHIQESKMMKFIISCSINECMTLNILFSCLEEGRLVFSPSPVPAWAVMAN